MRSAVLSPEEFEQQRNEIEKLAKERVATWPVIELPDHVATGAHCPKCRSAAVTIEYQRGTHERCSVELWDWPNHYLAADLDIRFSSILRAKVLGAREHMERACVNCGYRWATDIAQPEETTA